MGQAVSNIRFPCPLWAVNSLTLPGTYFPTVVPSAGLAGKRVLGRGEYTGPGYVVVRVF